MLFLQEQVEDMKKKEERMEKQMNEIMAENKRLTEPLQKAREQVEELRKQVRQTHKRSILQGLMMMPWPCSLSDQIYIVFLPARKLRQRQSIAGCKYKFTTLFINQKKLGID